MLLNGGIRTGMYMAPVIDKQSDYTMTASTALRLRTGDRVKLGGCVNRQNIYSGPMTHFSGMLVKPDT